jgi:hypothetical protein
MNVEAAKPERKTTYSVVVENRNSWTQYADGTRECEITNDCGHAHRTFETAEKCLQRLTRSFCHCGDTHEGYCSRCNTHANSTLARWWGATIRESK